VRSCVICPRCKATAAIVLTEHNFACQCLLCEGKGTTSAELAAAYALLQEPGKLLSMTAIGELRRQFDATDNRRTTAISALISS
jgi:hypothetical protein